MKNKSRIKNVEILPKNKKEMLFSIVEIDDREFLNEIIRIYFINNRSTSELADFS